MNNSSSRRRFLQTLGLATGALAAGSFANAQEVAPLAPKKITIPDPNNIGPMTTWPPRKPGAIYMGPILFGSGMVIFLGARGATSWALAKEPADRKSVV